MNRLGLTLALLASACAGVPRGPMELVAEHAFTQEGGDTFTYPLLEVGNGWESRLSVTMDIDLGEGSAVRTETLVVDETNPVDPPEPYSETEAWSASREGRQVLLLPPDTEENGLSCALSSWDREIVLCGEQGTLSEWRVVE